MQRSNALCLNTWEKHQLKDYNYHLIVQRQQVHSTETQTSVLKALLKFRDFVSRVQDESAHYILPNHALFQVAARMPESRSELRDCLRTNWGPVQ